MGDEEKRQLELRLEVLHQVDDLRLDRHVERRHRFVGDDERRLEDERARDADALALTAGKLVRVAIDEVRVEADDAHDLLDALVGFPTAREAKVPQWFAHDVADGHAWVERRVRILKDHLHVLPQPAELLASQVREVGAFEVNVAGGGRQEANDDAPERRLAAPRLADQAERLPGRDGEIDAIDGVDDAASEQAATRREVLDQLLDPHQRVGDRRVRRRGDARPLRRRRLELRCAHDRLTSGLRPRGS